ncbi:hypothetical protein BDW62DRAFT_204624 [Aspergillus aurantiobrunneus]
MAKQDSSAENPPKDFKVIIIGGSIAGLTLAHCLQRAGISYTLLEKHRDFRPRLGGVLVIAPSGARIIDQLGLYESMRAASEPITTPRTGFPNGACSTQTWLGEFERRYGYAINVITRQEMLEVLYNGIEDRSDVHGGKEVTRICHENSGVTVHTADGEVYEGHLVVGADGVHSIAREEMLKAAGTKAMREKSDLASEYRVLVGMSNPVPGLVAGEQIVRCHDGFAIFIFCGSNNNIGWFVVDKLDRRYQYPETPEYSTADAVRFCEGLESVQIWEGVRFGAVFKARTSLSTALVEENVFQTWYHGRIVCIGDSVNKTSPNAGLGASMALESAAALANQLHQLVSRSNRGSPSDKEVKAMLREYRRSHYERCKVVGLASHSAIRAHTRDTMFKRLIGPLFMTSERMALLFQSMIAERGAKLEFLPEPKQGKAWGRTRCRLPTVRRWFNLEGPMKVLRKRDVSHN